LRTRILRGRSCASVLVIPRRKSALIRGLHGRRPWPNLSSKRPWGLTEEEGRGKGRGRGQGARRQGGGREGGRHGGPLGAPWCDCLSLFGPCLHAEHELEEVEEREEKEKREKEKERKNWKNC
jgi:hypothetical protein